MEVFFVSCFAMLGGSIAWLVVAYRHDMKKYGPLTNNHPQNKADNVVALVLVVSIVGAIGSAIWLLQDNNII